jgi:hypothetical protein
MCRTGTRTLQLSRDQARELLSDTSVRHEKAAGRSWDDIWSLTGLFDVSGDKTAAAAKAREADEQFTVLSTFSRHHAENARAGPDPELGLGAVLERDGTHWLCMQPRRPGSRCCP